MLVINNMKQTSLPNFEELNQSLHETTLKLHASQVHGIICGMYCGNPTSTAWLELVSGGEESNQTQAMLQTLYDVTVKQLNDSLFDFQLVLPSDSDTLPERAEALTLWCQGFLTGLKLTQIQIEGREPSEMTEAINDLIEIAKMNYEEVVVSEEDETAYVELIEYVRVAVILICEEQREASSGKKAVPSSDHLH